jgi:hypothetical protein
MHPESAQILHSSSGVDAGSSKEVVRLAVYRSIVGARANLLQPLSKIPEAQLQTR